MTSKKDTNIQEHEEIYSLQQLMYEYSKTIDTYSDPTFVRISQLLDKKLNQLQKHNGQKCFD
ncbi:Spo0E family sporulation regulatory protein-aspartic acid phosphatase [Alkalihalobacillus sp. AL-G]|uniref:Spo0E family sporulation regulatory protein-aspartic acid phosphatase n=1 Tax=Alkalihalobacillus sp. AL-G TaxID=2926399 RepID=UPI00272B4F3F|nr:Spo0E family sporulation regulatory protein-aspartic acid phosphatase [Alkalihalobacillus sp. AL-G]WLD93113.1 Spo0E family sporulation regulatory protein-aspartic acid phosphatase [Alkalihalobacillus sp. AL-G]